VILSRITDYWVPVYWLNIECKVVQKRTPSQITNGSRLYRGQIRGFSMYWLVINKFLWTDKFLALKNSLPPGIENEKQFVNFTHWCLRQQKSYLIILFQRRKSMGKMLIALIIIIHYNNTVERIFLKFHPSFALLYDAGTNNTTLNARSTNSLCLSACLSEWLFYYSDITDKSGPCNVTRPSLSHFSYNCSRELECIHAFRISYICYKH